MSHGKRIAFLEPFYGGSHQAFADGLITHSRHSIDLFSLPDRFWKWRTRGSALAFYSQLNKQPPFDLWLASDLVNLTELIGLTRFRGKTALYMHENQLTYPLQKGEVRDANHVMTDLISCAGTDLIIFNSHYHQDRFLNEAKRFIARLPDRRPTWLPDVMAQKSVVLSPGIEGDFNPSDFASTNRGETSTAGPVILWPHRWEWDKGPDQFLLFLKKLQSQQLAFSLVLLGARADGLDEHLARIETLFAPQILFSGEAKGSAYRHWLGQSDLVVSFAQHETFGLACVEAMAAGVFPLMPNRLSYPEITPSNLHHSCLYNHLDELVERVASWRPDHNRRRDVANWAAKFRWSSLIERYDRLIDELIGDGAV